MSPSYNNYSIISTYYSKNDRLTLIVVDKAFYLGNSPLKPDPACWVVENLLRVVKLSKDQVPLRAAGGHGIKGVAGDQGEERCV